MIGQVVRVQYRKNRPKRSYCFIHGADGEDYWCSLYGVEGINVGDEVTFKGGTNEKGFVASNVHRIT